LNPNPHIQLATIYLSTTSLHLAPALDAPSPNPHSGVPPAWPPSPVPELLAASAASAVPPVNRMRLPLSTALLALLASATSLAAPAAAQSDVDVDTISPKPYPNRVLLIRHGEKPKDGGVGLSRAGRKRAQCVRKVSRPVFFSSSRCVPGLSLVLIFSVPEGACVLLGHEGIVGVWTAIGEGLVARTWAGWFEISAVERQRIHPVLGLFRSAWPIDKIHKSTDSSDHQIPTRSF